MKGIKGLVQNSETATMYNRHLKAKGYNRQNLMSINNQDKYTCLNRKLYNNKFFYVNLL